MRDLRFGIWISNSLPATHSPRSSLRGVSPPPAGELLGIDPISRLPDPLPCHQTSARHGIRRRPPRGLRQAESLRARQVSHARPRANGRRRRRAARLGTGLRRLLRPALATLPRHLHQAGGRLRRDQPRRREGERPEFGSPRCSLLA